MKKFLALVLALVLALSLAACSGGTGYQIGIPADATNGGRALLLLQDLGILTLKEGVGLEATEQDIVENPHNVTIKAMEAANLPASLPDLDFAVINGNYASGAGIGDKVLTTEDAESVAAQTYGNVVAVKEGRENAPAVQALVAVLMSGDVQAWIEESYNGVVMPMGAQELDIPEIAEPVTLKVGASPSPHAEILEHVKPLLAEHNVELEIVEFDDYVMPNTGVDPLTAAAHILTFSQHQIFSKPDLSCTVSQCRLTNKACPLLAHLTFCHIRKILKQEITGYNFKYRIPKKFQTFIMMNLMQFVFIGIRTMCQCRKQQILILKLIINFLLQFF